MDTTFNIINCSIRFNFIFYKIKKYTEKTEKKNENRLSSPASKSLRFSWSLGAIERGWEGVESVLENLVRNELGSLAYVTLRFLYS